MSANTLHLMPEAAKAADLNFRQALGISDGPGHDKPLVVGSLFYGLNKNYGRLKGQVESYRQSEQSIIDANVERWPDPEQYHDPRDKEKGSPIWRLPSRPGVRIVQDRIGNGFQLVYAEGDQKGEPLFERIEPEMSEEERRFANQRNRIKQQTYYHDFGDNQDAVDQELEEMRERDYMTLDVYLLDHKLLNRMEQGREFSIADIMWCFKDDEGDNFDLVETPPALSSDEAEDESEDQEGTKGGQ